MFIAEDDGYIDPPGCVVFDDLGDLDCILARFAHRVPVLREHKMPLITWCTENIGADAIRMSIESYVFNPKAKWTWVAGRGYFFVDLNDAVAFKLAVG